MPLQLLGGGGNKLRSLKGKTLFFSMAGPFNDGTERLEIAKQLETMLNQKASIELNWGFLYFPRQIHMTTPYVTFFEGISKTFNDYQVPTFTSYQEYLEQGGMKGIVEHYRKRGKKYQKPEAVPDQMISTIAGFIFSGGQKDEAIALLENNLTSNPKSVNSHYALASLYERNNQIKKALKYFDKTLSLAKQQKSPWIGYIEKEIERVKGLL